MKKITLGFIGRLASGKGTVTAYLKEKYGCNTYRFSTMLRDVLDRMYIEKSRENLQKISKILREHFSQDIMSRVIAEDVKKDTGDLVVVDGVRRPSDITYLEKDPSFRLVFIDAEPKTRWQRLVKRNENPGDDTKTFETFTIEDNAESEQEIANLGAQAHYTIDNNGDMGSLYLQVDEILNKIRNEN